MKNNTTKKTVYTNSMLFDNIVELLKADGKLPDHLDYYLSPDYKTFPITNTGWDVFGITDYGGSEGIYTDMTIRGYVGNEKEGMFNIGVFKTLRTDEDAYKDMCILGAEFVFRCRKFVDEHWDDFDQDGYKVIEVRDGKPQYGCFIARTLDKAKAKAKELLEWRSNDDYIIIRCKATDKDVEEIRRL